MDIDSIKAKLEQLTASVQQLQRLKTRDDNVAAIQGRLLSETREMQLAIEGPATYVTSLRYQPVNAVVLLVALRAGLIGNVVEAHGQAKAADQIAKDCGLDKTLVVRTMRYLVSNLGICEDAGIDTWKSNDLADFVVTPDGEAPIEFSARFQWPAAGNFTQYLDDVGLRNLGQEPSAFTHRFGGTLWQVLEKDKKIKAVFDVGRLLDPTSADVLMVDVGGNRGHDLTALISQYPQFSKSRMILQDLEVTVSRIDPDELPGNIEKQAYDFFSGPQPVQGAAAYLLHNIIHDHNDENCLRILAHTAQSMSRTSRLLIADWVIRDENAQNHACYTDWAMMLLTSGGMERSLHHWEGLLDGAGLRIVKVWSSQIEGESVIEAMVK